MPPKTPLMTIESLPNELLQQILLHFPSQQLLPLTLVSHRFHDLILRILSYRLALAASLSDGHTLLLECYHPSAKLTEPPLFCTYLGTDGLEDLTRNAYPPVTAVSAGDSLRKMKSMYSRFRPHRRQLEPTSPRPGDIPGSRTHPGTPPTEQLHDDDAEPAQEHKVTQHVHLDGGELFTQLCATTNLVKVGPRNGLFQSFVGVSDGVVRVWRDWLLERSEADRLGSSAMPTTSKLDTDFGYASTTDRGVLWTSPAADVGIRFRVRKRTWRRTGMPLLVPMNAAQEDVPVSYEIAYEELLVRATRLLQVTERSLLEMRELSGKAIVFGSFV